MNIRNLHHGEDTLRYLGCKIWKLVPDNIKTTSVKQLKIKIQLYIVTKIAINNKPMGLACSPIGFYIDKYLFIKNENQIMFCIMILLYIGFYDIGFSDTK